MESEVQPSPPTGTNNAENNDNTSPTKCNMARNLVGFWLLGLCNNFGYVIMLSAAHDILADHHPLTNVTNSSATTDVENRSGKLVPECNKIGTGAILLADILPALIVKLTAPWYMQSIPYSVRVILVVVLGAASFPVVALPRIMWVNLIGVALASAGSGLGELTFLSLTSQFHRNTISTWSSGTGAAGVFGALSYAGLTALGVSPRDTILIMLVIPAVLAVSYFLILTKQMPMSEVTDTSDRREAINSQSETGRLIPKDANTDAIVTFRFIDRLALVKPLLKYMIPLGLVYFAEYFINQALYELIYFKNIWLPIVQQYRWYQLIYQIGVLISRSSVNLIKIKKIWILSSLQFLVVALLLLQIFFHYLPSIWLIFFIILFEGLLGGCAYVNTFYWISYDYKDSQDRREFSLGVASIGDSFGISLAGAVSLPIHNLFCRL